MYNLPDFIDGNVRLSKDNWNRVGEKCIRNKSESHFKKELDKYSRSKYLNVEEEKLNLKDHVSEINLRNARTYFRIRSHMIDTRFNRKSD